MKSSAWDSAAAEGEERAACCYCRGGGGRGGRGLGVRVWIGEADVWRWDARTYASSPPCTGRAAWPAPTEAPSACVFVRMLCLLLALLVPVRRNPNKQTRHQEKEEVEDYMQATHGRATHSPQMLVVDRRRLLAEQIAKEQMEADGPLVQGDDAGAA
jgi:hypothetical protein